MRVLLFTGKGGAGTTTVAAATAVHAARRGTKTLLLAADPPGGTTDALGAPVGGDPAEVEPGLYAQRLDGRDRLAAWSAAGGRLTRLLSDDAGQVAQELHDLPGARELLTLLEVRDRARGGPWDLLVVDLGSADGALRLLALPEAVGSRVSRLLPAQQRLLAGLARGGRAAGRAGAGLPSPAVLTGLQELRTALAEVRELLVRPETSVRLVLTPETAGLADARRTLTGLSLLGYAVDAVVANRLVPSGDDPWRSGWAAAQAARLAGFVVDVAPVPVLSAGYAEREPAGPDALAELGAALHGEGDPAAPVDLPAPVRVERGDGELVLDLALPLVRREDVDLLRAGDDLVLDVGGRRRTLNLPSALRRCTVAGAALRDGRLRVRFVPDPDLWRPL